MKPVRNPFLLIMVALVLGACAPQPPVTQPPMVQPAPLLFEKQIEADPRVVLDIDDAADDVKIVLAALVNRMKRNIEPIEGVIFDHPGDVRIEDAGFLNQGFALNLIDITGYRAEPVSHEQAYAFIEGYFQFRDMTGRTATFYFQAAYSQTYDMITIHSGGAVLMPPALPVLETYFVPVPAFSEIPPEEFMSFTDLYLFALMHSVPMNPDAVFTGPENYYILVFCMSRIFPGASLEMTVSRTRGSEGKSLAVPVYFSRDDWRVLIAGHHFNPHAERDQDMVSINIAYNSNPASGTRPVQAGVFANRKNTGTAISRPVNIRVITREQAVIIPVDAGLGPLESGYILLDPSRRADAVEIQKQLFQLGFYQMKVDGLFGKGSRSALQKFKKDNHLGEDATWDIETQKALFRDSGK